MEKFIHATMKEKERVKKHKAGHYWEIWVFDFSLGIRDYVEI